MHGGALHAVDHARMQLGTRLFRLAFFVGRLARPRRRAVVAEAEPAANSRPLGVALLVVAHLGVPDPRLHRLAAFQLPVEVFPEKVSAHEHGRRADNDQVPPEHEEKEDHLLPHCQLTYGVCDQARHRHGGEGEEQTVDVRHVVVPGVRGVQHG